MTLSTFDQICQPRMPNIDWTVVWGDRKHAVHRCRLHHLRLCQSDSGWSAFDAKGRAYAEGHDADFACAEVALERLESEWEPRLPWSMYTVRYATSIELAAFPSPGRGNPSWWYTVTLKGERFFAGVGFQTKREAQVSAEIVAYEYAREAVLAFEEGRP